MHTPSLASVLALVGAAGLPLAGCQERDAPCSLSICNIEDEACHAEAFDVIACAREFHGEPPPVEVIGPGEYDERFAGEPEDATARLRRQQLTELLRALQLETMAPPDDERPIAFYSLDDEQVIVVTTNAFDDETRVFVLMQALANAQQAEEIDLRFLLQEQPTTDAAIAAAALVYGEAYFSANLGMQLRRTGIELESGLQFYGEQVNEAGAVANDRSVPYGVAIGEFIYGYGGYMAAARWEAEGREGLSELLRTRPQSTFAVFRTYLGDSLPGSPPIDPPDPFFELEAPYEVFAADTLGAWMLEMVLGRAGLSGLWRDFEWLGDEALFIGGETPTDAAFYWRLELGASAEQTGEDLETAATERGLPWFHRVIGGSVILVVTPDAAALPEWTARLGL